MACLNSLKKDIRKLKTIFPKDHNRFQMISASVDELTCNFIGKNGARTLLRLNRALEFVSMFIMEINKIDDHTGTGNSAREAYYKTLAKYHPWYIRQAASIAMYTLPTKAQFVSKIFHKYPNFEEKSINMLENFSQICDNCYNVTQKFYEQNNLDSLP